MKAKKEKKKFGDRKDGKLVRNQDGLHVIMPYIYPNRCDNEAFIQETIDVTNLLKYIQDKNSKNPEHPYKVFHAIVSTMVKTLVLRPNMNRFIQGRKTYQRNHLSVSFVIKKQFTDTSEEGMAFLFFDENDTIDTVHQSIMKEIVQNRSSKSDGATDIMDTLKKLPSFILRFVMWVLKVLDYHGRMPSSIANVDMNYSSVFLSNLGSIKLNAGYHHLTNRGTNSIFVVIGEMHKAPFYDEEGNVTMRDVIELGLTIDERIGDGYYFSKTIRLMKHLLTNPELLELPASEEIDY